MDTEPEAIKKRRGRSKKSESLTRHSANDIEADSALPTPILFPGVQNTTPPGYTSEEAQCLALMEGSRQRRIECLLTAMAKGGVAGVTAEKRLAEVEKEMTELQAKKITISFAVKNSVEEATAEWK